MVTPSNRSVISKVIQGGTLGLLFLLLYANRIFKVSRSVIPLASNDDIKMGCNFIPKALGSTIFKITHDLISPNI